MAGAVRLGGVEAVLFDFDGTLVDASRAICQAFNAALRGRGRPPADEAAIRARIGRPLVEMFRAADPDASPAALEECVAAYREAWGPIAVPLSRPMPGMPETVERLSARAKLGVVTSRVTSGAERILEAMGLLGRFGAVVGLEQVTRPKPDPEAVLRALAALGVAPARALMVGDTPDDVRAGRAAGARAVGVTTGAFDAEALAEAGADAVVGRLAEILELLD